MASNVFNPQGAPAKAPDPFNQAANQPATATNGVAAAPPLDNQTQHVPEPLPDITELSSEQLTASEGDAFASPPPPEDRIYRVRLSLRGVKAEDAKNVDITKFLAPGSDIAPWIPDFPRDKGGNLLYDADRKIVWFAKTIINVQIFDPKFPEFDGIYLQVPFKWTDTKVGGRQKTSKIMTILSLAGNRPDGNPWVVTKPVPQKYDHKELMEIFQKFLAGEPEINCMSNWSASCDVCGKAVQAVRQAGGYADYPKSTDGMIRFPPVPGKVGVYSPDLPCLVNRAHGTTKARAMAVQFFALDGVKK